MARGLTLAVLVAGFSIAFSGLVYFLGRYQDADLTLHFYEHFGASPDTVLRGKVVWIVGASSGIGEHLAYEFAKHGSKLVLSARRVKDLQRVKHHCMDLQSDLDGTGDEDNNILILPLDLLKYETHKNATDTVLRHFGQVDILINNAANYLSGYVEDVTFEQEMSSINTNLMGTISLTKTVLPHLMSRRQGHIAVTNSVAGKWGFLTTAALCAGKYGLKGYFDVLRLELLPYNITVSVHIVGAVSTPVIPDPKTGEKKRITEVLPASADHMNPLTEVRCAQLMVTAIINNLDEPWISRHPMLKFTYISQYFPGIYQWYSKTIQLDWILQFFDMFYQAP